MGKNTYHHLISGLILISLMLFWQKGLYALDPKKSISQFNYQIWQTEDGLPNNFIVTIIQTQDGYIWLGTQKGLVRFDGVRFTIFDKDNTREIKNNHILALFEDHQHNLWIGTNGGGMNQFKNGVFTSYSTKDGLSNDVISCISEDRNNQLWVGTRGGGINKIQKGNISFFTDKNGLSSNFVSSILEDHDGSLWIGTDNGLNNYKEGKFIIYKKKNGLAGNAVNSLLMDKKNNLWVGTSGGTSVIRSKNKIFSSYTNQNGLSNNTVLAIHEDRDGEIWIGTSGGGLNRFKNGNFTSYTTKDGLSNNDVNTIFEDKEGTLWIGTDSGLNQISDGKFTTYTTREGLSNDISLTILEDRKGNLWIGTFTGLTRLRDHKFKIFTSTDGLANNIIRSLFEDRKGNLWIGTDGGLSRYKDGKFKSYTSTRGLSNKPILSICEDLEGAIWLGTVEDGLKRFKDGKIFTYNIKNGLFSNHISVLYEDRAGYLWIGTKGGGLSRFKNGKFLTYTSKKGLSNNDILSIYEDNEGVLWLGTNGGGLDRLKNGKFFTYNTKIGLFDDVIYQVLEDGKGNFWLSSNKGIFQINKYDLDDVAKGKIGTINSVPYGKLDGMKSSECNGGSQPAGWKSRDGRFWFPTMKGVAMINPNNIKINLVPPPVIIEQVIVDNESIDINKKISLSPGKEKFEFNYTGLSYFVPKKVQFKYKLEKFDKDWVDAGIRRTAYYTNIPPGNYKFKVIASNNDGVWNESGATLDFYLSPYFYQRYSFYILSITSILLLSTGLYRLRLSQIRSREKELVLLVQERTRNLLEEKSKIENILNELARTNEELQKANELKTQLLSIAAHDLKNPLQSIIGFAELINKETSKNSPIAKKSGIIYHSSERMLKLINELLETVSIENGNLKLNCTSLNISHVVKTLVKSNQQQAKKKKQRILLLVEGNYHVKADEGRIREAMDNLISNAIKFSPKEKRIWIKLLQNGKMVRFEVQDEGPGLTEEDMKKLFGKFQRLTARPSGGESSTGLGLSIVKQIIELHEGRVWAESKNRNGSLFIIELPVLSEGSV